MRLPLMLVEGCSFSASDIVQRHDVVNHGVTYRIMSCGRLSIQRLGVQPWVLAGGCASPGSTRMFCIRDNYCRL